MKVKEFDSRRIQVINSVREAIDYIQGRDNSKETRISEKLIENLLVLKIPNIALTDNLEIVCDRTNNTPDDIKSSHMNVSIVVTKRPQPTINRFNLNVLG